MSRTFLSLAQKLRQESGGSGSGPASCQNQTGEPKRFVDWVNDAWKDVQELHEDWDFLRKSFSFQTTSQLANYSASAIGLTDFAVWKKDTFRLYTTSMNYADEQILPYLDWDDYRNFYQFANQRFTYTKPATYSISPDKQIYLGNSPDAVGYTVLGDYFATPSQFVADTDTLPTAFPDKFWMVIIYKAKMKYALYEENLTLFATAEKEYKSEISKLEANQLPSIGYGEPLA